MYFCSGIIICNKEKAMHQFDYKTGLEKLLTPSIVRQLSLLHEFRGKQELYISAKPDTLSALLDIAKIQSTKASNSIEGIYTSDDRLHAIVMEKAAPRSRSEEEIAGYREVLATIHENYEYIPIRPNSILQLHRDLYSYSGKEIGGRFKNTDNIIAETDKEGNEHVRFTPTPAFQTPNAIDDLCRAFNEAMDEGKYDALLLIPMFVLDFLSIHPFNDGNGRMSRLLTLLLLYRSGYIAGKYISIEMLIEKTKTTYYEALKGSSIGWHDNKNDYQPFVSYYLGIIVKAYEEFKERVDHLHGKLLTKPDRIRQVFDKRLGKITKNDIAALCPDISITTIERTLREMLQNGEIQKIGSGRTTGYVSK